MAFTVSQVEIPYEILEGDKAYSKHARFFDNVANAMINTGVFTLYSRVVESTSTDSIKITLQYKNTNIGIKFRSSEVKIYFIRLDNSNNIIVTNSNNNYLSGEGTKTLLLRYNDIFMQTTLVGIGDSVGEECNILDAKDDISLIRCKSIGNICDSFGRQITKFYSGSANNKTFNDEILLIKPLPIYADTQEIQDDYTFSNKYFFISSSFISPTHNAFYVDETNTKYLLIINIFGDYSLIME